MATRNQTRNNDGRGLGKHILTGTTKPWSVRMYRALTFLARGFRGARGFGPGSAFSFPRSDCSPSAFGSTCVTWTLGCEKMSYNYEKGNNNPEFTQLTMYHRNMGWISKVESRNLTGFFALLFRGFRCFTGGPVTSGVV